MSKFPTDVWTWVVNTGGATSLRIELQAEDPCAQPIRKASSYDIVGVSRDWAQTSYLHAIAGYQTIHPLNEILVKTYPTYL